MINIFSSRKVYFQYLSKQIWELFVRREVESFIHCEAQCSTSESMKMLSCLRSLDLSKQATVVVMVLWLFTAQFILQELVTSDINTSYFTARVGVMSSLFLYPFFGWLADTKYGRYTVIKVSLYIVWMISIFYCLLLVILDLLSTYGKIKDLERKQSAVHIAWSIVLSIGLGGLLANIVQFGIDQLQDRSSSEIVSFFRWNGLAWLIATPLIKLLKTCLYGDYKLVNALVLPGLLSVMLSLNYFFSSWLVKEPVSKNPLVTIFNVLKFAWDNKYPRLRSAYSYWNTSFCARIDLAKSEYGGPFTAVDVEDTKAFWRIISLMSFASFFASCSLFISDDISKTQFYFKNGPSSEEQCSRKFILNLFVEYLAVIVIAIFLLILKCPPFSRLKDFINGIPMLPRALLGMVLFLMAIGGYGTLETLGHFLNDSRNHTCVLDVEDYPSVIFTLDYKWTSIPNFLILVSDYVLLIAAAEFLCAQSPYSMKGLLFGLLFGSVGVSSAISFALLLPLKLAINKSPVSSLIGCGSVYCFSVLLILAVTSACFICSCKFYHRRERIENERDGEIPNVNYFS